MIIDKEQKLGTVGVINQLEDLARELREDKLNGEEIEPTQKQQQKIYKLLMEIGELTGAFPLSISVRKAARIMGLPDGTLYRLVRRTDFPSFRTGEQGWAVIRDRIRPWMETEANKEKVKTFY